LGKILSDPFELRIHKTETRKVLKEKKDGVSQNKYLTLNPIRQKAFSLQFKGFWIRPLQLSSVLKAHTNLGTSSWKQVSGTWTVIAWQDQAL